jgi:hypothetical protein
MTCTLYTASVHDTCMSYVVIVAGAKNFLVLTPTLKKLQPRSLLQLQLDRLLFLHRFSIEM